MNYPSSNKYGAVPRSRLVFWEFFLTILTYGLFAIYAADWINGWMFCALVMTYFLRLFDIRHAKIHADDSKRAQPLWFDKFCDYFQIFYLPYHETFVGKKKKHLSHHRVHQFPERYGIDDLKANPHYVFEQHSAWRAFLSSMFYEEIMVLVDIRQGKVGKERLIMATTGIAILSVMIYFGGWGRFFVFAGIYRATFALSWFTFSYVTHAEVLYTYTLDNILPGKLREWVPKIVGRGAFNSIFFHRTHHEHISVPSHFLHELSRELAFVSDDTSVGINANVS